MMTREPEDKEVVWISVPLDGLTAARLGNLADACHNADPSHIAASLLHDVLADDEQAEYPAATAPGTPTVN